MPWQPRPLEVNIDRDWHVEINVASADLQLKEGQLMDCPRRKDPYAVVVVAADDSLLTVRGRLDARVTCSSVLSTSSVIRDLVDTAYRMKRENSSMECQSSIR